MSDGPDVIMFILAVVFGVYAVRAHVAVMHPKGNTNEVVAFTLTVMTAMLIAGVAA